MTLPNEVNPLLRVAASTAYTINNSLRFRSSASAYLNRTPSVAGNRTTWTWSGWVKRGALSTQQALFSASNGGGSAGDWVQIVFDATTNGIDFIYYSSAVVGRKITTPVYRDPSSWYHIVAVFNTTSATGEDRMQLWINGVRLTASQFSTNTILAQNTSGTINSTNVHEVGALNYTPNTNFFDGYLAEVNFIDGQALTPSSFGAYSSNGVWQPARYTGTYGTNGFYLKFASFGTTAALGTDSSGNGNTWTVNNISVTAGTTYDPMLDSPTLTSATVANYAVINPISGSGQTISNANLTLSGSSVGTVQRQATIIPSSGKWYFEVNTTWDAAQGDFYFGISKSTVSLSTTPGASADSYAITVGGSSNTRTINGGAVTTYGATPASPVTLQVAVDLDNLKIWFGVNNSWVTGSPSAGTSPAYTIASSGSYAPAFRASNGSFSTTGYVNFGQQGFVYTPPTGFVALNAYNLATPTIANGATVMAATTYTSQGTTPQTVVNTGNTPGATNGYSNNPAGAVFTPDLVWTKPRSITGSNVLNNSVVGASKYLVSDTAAAEVTNAQYITSFNSGGFSVGTSGWVSGTTMIGWQWLAGAGSSSSNTNGSITSTVSVNATAGFSVVTYTGNGTNPGATIGHGLGVTPSMIITKSRSTTGEWPSYHSALSITNTLYINATYASSTYLNRFSSVSSTTFTTGSSGSELNTNGTTYVAYCWSAVAGYSAFGSYTGNGSSDGPFVYTGFRPRWVMLKRSDSTGDWWIFDTSRDTYDVMNNVLYANLNNAESTGNAGGTIDFLSNGFKLRCTAQPNTSSATFIYAAYAENPFKYALAR